MSEYLCFARGHEGSWEGVCLDLDIAVQGESFEEVQNLLQEAILEYCHAAREEEDQAAAARLLNRAAPWRVRLLWTWRVLASSWRKTPQQDISASFPVACAA